jgi:hypothetical protein
LKADPDDSTKLLVDRQEKSEKCCGEIVRVLPVGKLKESYPTWAGGLDWIATACATFKIKDPRTIRVMLENHPVEDRVKHLPRPEKAPQRNSSEMTTAQGMTALLGAALQSDAAFRETMAAHAENPEANSGPSDDEDESSEKEQESPPSKPEARKRAHAEKGSALRPSRRNNQPQRFEAGAAKNTSSKRSSRATVPKSGLKANSKVVAPESPSKKRIRAELESVKGSCTKKEKQNRELQKKCDELGVKLANLERDLGTNAEIATLSSAVERLELLHTATRQLAMAMAKDPDALGIMLDNLQSGFLK